MKVFKTTLPENSILFGTAFDYADSYKSNFSSSEVITQKELGKAFFLSAPKWVGALMTLRNTIVSVFGLKTGGSITKRNLQNEDFDFKKGQSVGIFKIYDKNENEIIMGEDDSHLDFRVSLLLQPQNDQKALTISTLVTFNNWLGKLYFLPVKPFHKIIVRNMLKRTLKELER
ncbi:DUF2867 domain-containing protein [Aquimarina sp. D1M17]|uniref:DUF2867 domain-containing protein n=1 Tax=Aquimarina acroporae TaxID=2937283 RepID=UPI0020C0953D|nr:DUF2867 domain-containing protein [Aquimarina acroporae]MCK8522939.1 DUF2867 domain-containing protein [Aquimarina acroporae]